MRRVLPVLAVLAFTFLVPQVAAHAEPWQSEPGSGERVAEPPQEVVVHFTERVYSDGTWIEVWDLSGNRVDLDDLTIEHGERPVLRISVPPLEEGPYLVKWQTYSQTDGHTIRGAIGFSVGGFAPPEGQSTTGEVPVTAGFARALIYLGYVAAIGTFAFQWLVLRNKVDASQRSILDGLIMAGSVVHLTGLIWLLADTALRTGVGFINLVASPGGIDLWIRIVIGVALVALGTLWLYGPVRPRSTIPVLATIWIAAVAAGARFGHGGTPASWFVQTVHGISIAAWLGGLAILFILLLGRSDRRKDVKEVKRLGLRFSTLAITTVTAMAVTGVILSLTVIGVSFFDVRLWTDNAWRSFLTAKITLALFMILLAAVNRQVFLADDKEVGPVRRAFRRFADQRMRWQSITEKGGTSDFRNVVATEAVFGVAVLVCAGFLMSVAAPAEGLEPDAAVYETTGTGNEFTARLQTTPEPAEGEFSEVRIFIKDFDDEPLVQNTCRGQGEVRNDCVRLSWRPTGQNESAQQETIGVPEGEGWWLFKDVLWTTHGSHDLLLQVSSQYTFSDKVPMTVEVLRSDAGGADDEGAGNRTEEDA